MIFQRNLIVSSIAFNHSHVSAQSPLNCPTLDSQRWYGGHWHTGLGDAATQWRKKKQDNGFRQSLFCFSVRIPVCVACGSAEPWVGGLLTGLKAPSGGASVCVTQRRYWCQIQFYGWLLSACTLLHVGIVWYASSFSHSGWRARPFKHSLSNCPAEC